MMQTPETAAERIAPGVTIGSGDDALIIAEEIGRGGMGTVYKAWQASLNRHVAVKVLSDTAALDVPSGTRFLREAKAAATISHKSVVEVYKVGEYGSKPYIVMELVQGEMLSQILQRDGTLKRDQFFEVFSQLLKALACLHSAGFVHRDIKPSNIVITTDGITKLMDFGIVKSLTDHSVSQKLTQTGAMLGSPWYMSPEQCSGSEVDARSDIYSVGCTMHEALSGEAPFSGETALEVMLQHLNEQADTLSNVADKQLSGLVRKAMAKAPDDRFQSADEFLAALESCHSGKYQPTQQKKVRAVEFKTKTLVRAAILCVVGFAAMMLAMWQLTNRAAREDQSSREVISPYGIGKRLEDEIAIASRKANTVQQPLKKACFERPLKMLHESLAETKANNDDKGQMEVLLALRRCYVACNDAVSVTKYGLESITTADTAYREERDFGNRMSVYLGVLCDINMTPPFNKLVFDQIADRADKQLSSRLNDVIANRYYARLLGIRAGAARNHGDADKYIEYAKAAFKYYDKAETLPTWDNMDLRLSFADVLCAKGRWKELSEFATVTLPAVPQTIGDFGERDAWVLRSSASLAHNGCLAAACENDRRRYDRFWKHIETAHDEKAVNDQFWIDCLRERAVHLSWFKDTKGSNEAEAEYLRLQKSISANSDKEASH